jgi:erythromycin esterase
MLRAPLSPARAWLRACLGLACVLAVAAALVGSPAQRDNAPFARWAADQAIPIATAGPHPLTADPGPLKAMIGPARVVALGEPSHGAHESLELRNRLFRFLVEELGFTAIAIESGLPESRRVFDFVNGAPGVAGEVVRRNLTWGFGAFPENEALIQWMRDHNASERRTRIRFYGIDLSLGGPGGSTPTPAALDEVLSYLARADPAAARRSGALLRPFLDRLADPGGPPFSPVQHEEFTAAIEAVLALLDRNRAALVAATSHEDYDWAHQQAVVARHADRVFRVLPPDVPGGRIPPSAWRAVSARGAGMSENVRWVVEREGPAGRVLVFAHNAHVKNAPTEGGVWSVFDRPPTVMGQHLRESLGDELLIIGTSLAAGSGGRPAPRPGSLDAALARVGLPLFLIDFRTARADRAVSAWLADRRPLTANGDTFLAVSPGAAFDAMLFINAHALPRAP